MEGGSSLALVTPCDPFLWFLCAPYHDGLELVKSRAQAELSSLKLLSLGIAHHLCGATWPGTPLCTGTDSVYLRRECLGHPGSGGPQGSSAALSCRSAMSPGAKPGVRWSLGSASVS